ncbi:MAG: EAL domain-containing protein [Xanthomonadales bacterium]|nr:EAL domain-containing protein [Xanthomonadales bacterium]
MKDAWLQGDGGQRVCLGARLLVGALLVLVSITGHAAEREYYFQRLDDSAGLLQNSIRATYQDRTGFLWVGTQGALHQFDGYRFRRHEHDADDAHSLPDSVVQAITEDGEGNLWIGTYASGVARFDPRSGRFEAFELADDAPARNERNTINALAHDPARGLWIGTRGGLELFDLTTAARQRVGGTEGHAIRRLLLGHDGSVWVATADGLLRVPRGSDRAERVAVGLAGAVAGLVEGRDHRIYVATATTLSRIDPASGADALIWTNSQKAPITTLAEDGDGRVWLGTHGDGLAIVDVQRGREEWVRPNPRVSGSLQQAEITTLLVDRSGLLWVGADSLGLSSVDPAGATFRYLVDRNAGRDGAGTNNTRAILEDRAGQLWFGTDGDGVKRYDPQRRDFTYFRDTIARAFGAEPDRAIGVESLAAAEDGGIWFASNVGIGLLDPVRNQVTVLDDGLGLDPHPTERVRRALVMARDGSLWLGTSGNGVTRYAPGTRAPTRWRHRDGDAATLSHDHVLTLFEDSRGRIWAGTVDGLNIIDPSDGSVRVLRHDPTDPHSLSGNIVRSIHEGVDGSFWIGTHSGLNHLARLDDGPARLRRYLPRDGLPDATVYAILEDGMHRLWISSNRGIASFDPVASVFHSFLPRDGLQGLEFNGGAFAALRNGDFAFGGIEGVNFVSPTRVVASRFTPPVVITDVRIGNEARRADPAKQGVAISQDDRVVHFEFAALDFTAPASNQFRYRLEGFDEAWVEAGSRHEATYTNLDPGRYMLRVQASNHDGYWNETGAALPLAVEPLWWNSLPMKAVYGLLLALAGLLIWNARRSKRVEEGRYHREIKEREDRLRLALWGSGDRFWDLDMDSGALVTLSADSTRGSQRESSLSVYEWLRTSVHPDDQRVIAQRLDDHITGKAPLFESEQRVSLGEGGPWLWVLARGKIVERSESGRPLRICGTARNITASREAERERRIAQEVIGSMGEAVSVTDLDFRFVSVNPAFTRITGWQEHEVRGRSASLLNCAQHSPEHYQSLRDTLMRDGHWRGELWQRRKDGEEFLSWLQATGVSDASGQRTHFVQVLTDITERKRTEQELRYLANYDPLTGLPNRTLLSERLGHAVVRARRGGRKVAVLFLDLDRFKHVNDSMGHAAGDRMLKAAGSRLRDNVRDGDTVARIGGDEFTVVLEDLVDASEAERVAQKLISAFEQPLELEDGQDVTISPSIGVSLYPDHGQAPTDLIKFADTAMYQAKERGRKTYMVYTETMDASARLRATMIGALRKALERDEFSLAYQPKLSLLDERVTGVEALLRWRSEELGEILPSTFIPIAEETGMIVEIGDWVLVQACSQLAAWHRAGLRDISVSVNVSVLQLLRGDLTQRLCDILADSDLPPSQLELELTESMVMANAEQSITTLRQLKGVGVTLSIDDFGTGYSSLSYLKRLPIDTLKIDKEFVGDITTDPDDEAITATVINMAHSLGLNVVAEGVETAEQVEYLREQGCDEIQGHWLARPLAATQCFAFLRQRAERRRDALGEGP